MSTSRPTLTGTAGPSSGPLSGRGRWRLRHTVRAANLTLIRAMPDHLQARAGTALMAILQRDAERQPDGQPDVVEPDQDEAAAEAPADDSLSLFGQEEAA